MSAGLTQSDRQGQGKVSRKSFTPGGHFGVSPYTPVKGVFSLRVSFPTISSMDPYVDRRGKNFFSVSTVTPQLLSHVSETKFSMTLSKVQSVDEKLLILDISPPNLLGGLLG